MQTVCIFSRGGMRNGSGPPALETGRDVSGEDGEHHHPGGRQQDGQDLAGGSDRENVAPHRRDVHAGPPDRIPIFRNQRVDPLFKRIENDAGEIGDGKKGGRIGYEEVGDPAAGHPADDHGHSVAASNQRDGPDGQFRPMRKVEVGSVKDIHIGNGYEKKQDVPEKESPPVRAAVKSYKKVRQEYHANPELGLEDEVVVVGRNVVEYLHRKHDQDGDTSQQNQNV